MNPNSPKISIDAIIIRFEWELTKIDLKSSALPTISTSIHMFIGISNFGNLGR